MVFAFFCQFMCAVDVVFVSYYVNLTSQQLITLQNLRPVCVSLSVSPYASYQLLGSLSALSSRDGCECISDATHSLHGDRLGLI